MRKPMKDIAEPKGFDLTVTHRDPQTGLITKVDPYIKRVSAVTGSNERSRMWERPAGSGNLFDKQGNAIGRWIYEDKMVHGKLVRGGKYDPDAKHIEWAPPLTADQKVAQENAALKAELAARDLEIKKLQGELAPRITKPAPNQQKKEQGA